MAVRVLMAFSEWLKLTSSRSLDGAALAQHPLVTAALEGLNSERTFDGAVDAVVELVYVSSSGGQPEEKMLPLVARLVPAVRALSTDPSHVAPYGSQPQSSCALISWPIAAAFEVSALLAGAMLTCRGQFARVKHLHMSACWSLELKGTRFQDWQLSVLYSARQPGVLQMRNWAAAQVMQLLPRFVRASQQAATQSHAADDGSEEEDEEIAKGMARLFAEVGENFCGLIATGARPAQSGEQYSLFYSSLLHPPLLSHPQQSEQVSWA